MTIDPALFIMLTVGPTLAVCLSIAVLTIPKAIKVILTGDMR